MNAGTAFLAEERASAMALTWERKAGDVGCLRHQMQVSVAGPCEQGGQRLGTGWAQGKKGDKDQAFCSSLSFAEEETKAELNNFPKMIKLMRSTTKDWNPR